MQLVIRIIPDGSHRQEGEAILFIKIIFTENLQHLQKFHCIQEKIKTLLAIELLEMDTMSKFFQNQQKGKVRVPAL
ncbi:hypothetical protein B9T65_23155 [Serratia marcescens]|nr:hypothetical protein AR325_24105 [Serratia marcescens]PHI44824.1 hypothetical protein B9T65_23155 [Serratia marcescens]